MRRSVPLAAALAAATLVAAGCGSSDSSSPSTTSGAASSGAQTGGGYGYGGMMTTPHMTQSGASATAAATVKTASTPLGTVLVDGSGRTLYLFERDTGASSTCNGACAQAWPPLTTSGAAKAAGRASAARLGTTSRSDGTTEVTYAGHPLYYYAGDSGPGSTDGQNVDAFGAEWYVLAPSGNPITGNGS